MKKRFEVFMDSLKQSALHKPAALAMFILMIIMATVACGFSSRTLVGEIEREFYPEKPNITFKDTSKYVQVGDYMRNIKDEYFDYYYNLGNIEGFNMVEDFEVNGEKKELGRVEINFEVFANKLAENDIKKCKKVMYINKLFSDKTGLHKGNTITFCGTDFVIVGIDSSGNDGWESKVTIPYSVQLADSSNIQIENLNFYGLKKNFNKKIYDGLEKIGVIKGKKYLNSVIFQSAFMLLAFLVASGIAVITVTNYWQSVNMRKYKLYKAIGASPKVVGGIMFFETGVISALSVAIGLLFDFILNLIVEIGSISKMLWLHYLILFFATLFVVMIMVSIKIVKIAKALPMEQPAAKKVRK